MEIEVNDGNFKKEVLDADLPVLVDFWAAWCGPCLIVAPFVEEISNEYDGKLKVCKVNVDEAPKTSSEYEIMSIPTLAIFKDGNLVDKIIGAVPKNIIEEKLRPYI